MKFEYLHLPQTKLSAGGISIEAALNKLGDDGWQMVGWLSTVAGPYATFIRVKELTLELPTVDPACNGIHEWSEPVPDVAERIKALKKSQARPRKPQLQATK